MKTTEVITADPGTTSPEKWQRPRWPEVPIDVPIELKIFGSMKEIFTALGSCWVNEVIVIVCHSQQNPAWSTLGRSSTAPRAIEGEQLEHALHHDPKLWFAWRGLCQKRKPGWWLGHPSEKYESIGMISNPIYGKIENGNQTTNQKRSALFRTRLVPLLLANYHCGISRFHSLFHTSRQVTLQRTTIMKTLDRCERRGTPKLPLLNGETLAMWMRNWHNRENGLIFWMGMIWVLDGPSISIMAYPHMIDWIHLCSRKIMSIA